MRIFIAADIPNNIKSILHNLQKQIVDNVKITLVKPENMHLTLKFLGEVDKNILDEARIRLKDVKFKPFDVSLDNLGVFPHENYMRVLWIGVKGRVNELSNKIDPALADLFPKEKKFHAHITLGRIKFISDKLNFKERLKIRVEGSFKVNSFRLIRSELTENGPRYEILEDYPL